jgi:hypothetical protein
MKGLKIYYKQKTINAAVPDGDITLNLFHRDGDSRIYIGAVDYVENAIIDWCDFSEIEIGDKFEIEISEIGTPSAPAKMKQDMKIKRPKTKLEIFFELENKLKQEGLL